MTTGTINRVDRPPATTSGLLLVLGAYASLSVSVAEA